MAWFALIAAGGAAAAGAIGSFLGTAADTAVQVFHIIILVLMNMVSWLMDALKQLLDFQRTQPLAFTILVASILLTFILSPFILGINLNHLIFGQIVTYQETIAPTPTIIENLSNADFLAAMSVLHLVKSDPNMTVKPIFPPKPMPMFLGGKTVYEHLFPDNPLKPILYTTSVEDAELKFEIERYNQCGKLLGTPNNATIWEAKIEALDPDLIKRIELSIENPVLREFNLTLACYKMDVDPLTEISLPGSTWQEKAGNLSLFKDNGSLCIDDSLEYLSPITYRIEGRRSPMIILINLWNGINALFYNTNATGHTTTCYLMVNKDTRERIYMETPTWISKNGESGNFTARMFYGTQILNKPTISQKTLSLLGVIKLPVTTEYNPGIASIVTAPYEMLNSTSAKITGGATTPYFNLFFEIMTIIAMVILGTIGTLMILNTQEIQEILSKR